MNNIHFNKSGQNDSREAEEVILCNFNNYQGFAATVPVACQIGGREVFANTWGEFLVKVVNYEIKTANPKLKPLERQPLPVTGLKGPFLFSGETASGSFRTTICGLKVYLNYDLPQMINVIADFCRFVGYDESAIILHGRKKSASDTPNKISFRCEKVINNERGRVDDVDSSQSLKVSSIHKPNDEDSSENKSVSAPQKGSEEISSGKPDTFQDGDVRENFVSHAVPSDFPMAESSEIVEDLTDSRDIFVTMDNNSATDGLIRLNFCNDNYGDFAKAFPVKCRIGSVDFPANDWTKLLVDIVEYEIKRGNHNIDDLYEKPLRYSWHSDRGQSFFLKLPVRRKTNVLTTRLFNGKYLYTTYSAPKIVSVIKEFCIRAGYKPDEIILCGRKKRKDESESSVVKELKHVVFPDDSMASSYDNVSSDNLIECNFHNFDKFANTIPVNCSVDGRIIYANTWARLLFNIVKREFASNPNLVSLYSHPLPSSHEGMPFFLKKRIEGQKCKQLPHGFWINLNYNTPRLVEIIVEFCERAGFEHSEIILCGRNQASDVKADVGEKSYQKLPSFSNNSDISCTPEVTGGLNEQSSNIIRCNFKNYHEFTYAKPVRCQIGGCQFNVASWKDLLIRVVEREIRKANPLLDKLYSESLKGGPVPFFKPRNLKSKKRRFEELSNGYWIDVNNSAQDSIKRIFLFCRLCNYPVSQIVICGRRQ